MVGGVKLTAPDEIRLRTLEAQVDNDNMYLNKLTDNYVSKIIQGDNITTNPASGLGDVIVSIAINLKNIIDNLVSNMNTVLANYLNKNADNYVSKVAGGSHTTVSPATGTGNVTIGSDNSFNLISTISFAVVGDLTTGTDKAPTIIVPTSFTMIKVKLVVKTAPTGSAIVVDVNKNGTTIFTTQANRPQIATGTTYGDSGTPDDTALIENDTLTVDVDNIGSATSGSDLTIEIVCR